MASLVIDIGNTFIKLAVFEQNHLLQTYQYDTVNDAIINKLLHDYDIDKAIIASVKKEKPAWQPALAAKVNLQNFTAGMAKGIINHYKSMATLGADRLAGVMAANHLYPGVNNLVISGGTCITYDWVDAGGNYYGGSISPGLNMRYKTMNYYTDALPLVNADEKFDQSFGTDTVTAMQSGVQNGIKYELAGFISSYKNDKQGLNILLSGGDSIFFDTLLKNSIFAPCIKIEPYLVLKGLNAAIQNNND